MTHQTTRMITRYLALSFALNLVWEFAQMPLYTIWAEATAGEIAFAGAHCTVIDTLIAAGALGLAWLVAGRQRWPAGHYGRVAALAILMGLAFTVFSEWRNVYVAGNWAYAARMPEIFGIGLAPLAQWIIVPALAFGLARPRA